MLKLKASRTDSVEHVVQDSDADAAATFAHRRDEFPLALLRIELLDSVDGVAAAPAACTRVCREPVPCSHPNMSNMESLATRTNCVDVVHRAQRSTRAEALRHRADARLLLEQHVILGLVGELAAGRVDAHQRVVAHL